MFLICEHFDLFPCFFLNHNVNFLPPKLQTVKEENVALRREIDDLNKKKEEQVRSGLFSCFFLMINKFFLSFYMFIVLFSNHRLHQSWKWKNSKKSKINQVNSNISWFVTSWVLLTCKSSINPHIPFW